MSLLFLVQPPTPFPDQLPHSISDPNPCILCSGRVANNGLPRSSKSRADFRVTLFCRLLNPWQATQGPKLLLHKHILCLIYYRPTRPISYASCPHIINAIFIYMGVNYIHMIYTYKKWMREFNKIRIREYLYMHRVFIYIYFVPIREKRKN